MQTTGFFDAIQEFDVTLRTVITPYLVFKRREHENTGRLSTEETRSPSDNHSTYIRSSHSQDANFVENVVIIETGLSRTATKVVTKKASAESLQQFSEAEPQRLESVNSDREGLIYRIMKDIIL
ncbi:unnamed protein product [Hymenolepis diminuta]|uniref:Uncharacterized protein n=1 Tax=Hymenolepis diminuta TaxID=6216 RepID=A0A564Z044_HYMDI|nr:unnamed protein product [Hymenolepis diminuta]